MLVQRCVKGDRAAWEEFTSRYHRLIEYVVVNTLKSHRGKCDQSDIDDISEDVYVTLLNHDRQMLRRYDPKYSLTNWISMIARARTIDHYRKRKSLHLVSPSSGGTPDEEDTGFISVMAVGKEESPDSVPQKAEVRDLVNKVLQELPHRDRVILKLFFFEGKKYREIATILGMTVSMVASNVYRAKMKFMKKIQVSQSQ
ncbi:MAG: hypothetical protein A2Z34_03230 [Planctomycetes bacterium RBG_16_59_8]|nr:MAG: hypothetical protein A2Z34_03230 [Planctomycetes bacterium RBG_16_59_8]